MNIISNRETNFSLADMRCIERIIERPIWQIFLNVERIEHSVINKAIDALDAYGKSGMDAIKDLVH